MPPSDLRRPSKSRAARWARWAVNIQVALLIYMAVACLVFRFRHPHLTETEIIMESWAALTWGTVEKK